MNSSHAAGRRVSERVIFCCIGCLLVTLLNPAMAQEDRTAWETSFGGHSKFQFVWASFPDDSIFKEFTGSSAVDNNAEVRLKFSASRDSWNFKADYQFIAVYSDTLNMARELPGAPFPVNSVISDDRRWFDLTHVIKDKDKWAVVQRLDRLSIGFSTENSVWRFGRQAISWGNGMVFTPMDVFNPFDPSAVDKEYKTGDDMLYGQYLFNNGNDLQATAIVRRNPINGEVESDQSSLAFKYHGFAGMNEFDLLAAQHFGDQILGVGGLVSVGGSIWRGDLTWTDTADEQVFSAVASVSYSWVWSGKNLSGLLEYYHNGFGQKNSAYAPAELAQNPDLLRRLERGELFTLSRNYLAASATLEVTPLLLFIPNFFINLDDPSALAQFVTQYDWKQNLQLLAALSFPVGPSGSEYGGVESGIPGLYFSSGPSLFAQLAWYF